ncbi:Ferredoxin--NADP reductase, leaf isozyme, chloroplastic [Symbiodinium microadriaticum]|uniref:ferredoxin--NADP(+) reductase n=1 Tax=Symbiodinium microadriaticum TaxID=2951 RepID=A0A1Q9F7D8_SYMMI|nr:Ferredoxin--NADP reductase, leaf isozyme, chloroplastic [Symbiodinium microadriaticum]
MAQSAVGATLGAAALLGGCAFLAPSTPHAASAPAHLRGAAPGASSAAGAAAPLAGAALLATAAALARPTESATTRRAAAVKKKGVKVVHGKEIPWNLFTPKAPYAGKVIENDVHPQTLTEDTGDANWETCHVTFDHGGKVPYIEGQSIGIIAPGPDKKGETPARIRLYSIASSAVGDNQNSKTVSLCVKRVVELDGKFANREKGEDKPDKAGTGFPDNKVYRGVCSNHICDMSPGDDVMITGPTGAEMLLPEDPEANIIMLATGTGIAPMRSYCRLLFHDDAGASGDGRKFKGLAWLFMGVPYSKSLLYDDEHQEYKKSYPDQFKYDYAVSREEKNAAGQKMYIQTKMAEYADELWELMQDWAEFAKAMKKADRYHVEVGIDWSCVFELGNSAVGATLGAAALLGGCAFLAPSTPHAASAPAHLRGAAPGASSAAGAAAPLAGAALLATAAALARPTESATTRRAAAVKKKGVKVVHGKEIPWNLFTPKAPYAGKVIENDVHPQTLTEDTGDANWETCHVTFDHGGKVPYIEGQSIGIIAPGPDKKGETPARIRLYSIASSAVGDNQNSKTVSLCVKRVVELDGKFANREKGEDKPDKAGTGFPDNKVYRGVCSNHICDMSPGDDVMITGPTGAEMLLPEDPEANIIMLATGTGIAPMRSYCRLLFHDDAGASGDGRKFKGLAWLFMGVPYSKSLLYDDEHQEYKKSYPDQFKYDYAVSREEKNAAGQKMYIQTKMAEYADELWELMQDWAEFAKAMKKADRYHVEAEGLVTVKKLHEKGRIVAITRFPSLKETMVRNKLTDIQSDSQRAAKLDRLQKDILKQSTTQIWDTSASKDAEEIDGIPNLLQKYPRARFCLGANGPFFLQFYPNGDAQSQAGKCGLFLWGPDSVYVKARWAL